MYLGSSFLPSPTLRPSTSVSKPSGTNFQPHRHCLRTTLSATAASCSFSSVPSHLNNRSDLPRLLNSREAHLARAARDASYHDDASATTKRHPHFPQQKTSSQLTSSLTPQGLKFDLHSKSEPARLSNPQLAMDDLHVVDDLDVYIKVDGQRLEEYDDEDEESPPHVRTKYVVAQSGANFTIAYSFNEDFPYKSYDVALHIFLDGNEVYNCLLRATDFHLILRADPREVAAARHYEQGQYLYRKFAFSHLVIEEEGEKLDADQKKSIAALGEIKVKLWRVQITSEIRALDKKDEFKYNINSDQISKIPEKALKGRAVSHRTKLGEAQTGQAFRVVDTRNIDPVNKPFAVYNFRYRSLKALKSMRLIAQSPEPVSLEDRPIEDLSPEEMRELLRLQKERLERGGSVKRESRSETVRPKREPGYRSQWEDGDDLEVVEERPSKRRKSSDDPIETVDLTGD